MKTSAFMLTHIPGSAALQSLMKEYRNRATLSELGAKYSVSDETIRRALKEGKCTMRGSGKPVAFEGSALRLLVKEYQSGAVIPELADKYNVHPKTISRALKKGVCTMRVGREPGKPRWHWTAKQKRQRLKDSYGLTPESVEELWDEQNRRCAICGKPIPKEGRGMFIDHDHDTGKVRGLLCQHCNMGLGMFRDDVSNLQNAIEYLQIPT